MTRQILLVDDDEQLLLFLKGALEKYRSQFDVVLAGDGVAAQELLAQHPIALVVTDLKMPRLDGLGLLAYMLEHYPDIPAIVLTGFATPETERLAAQGRAVGFLGKPFLVETLAEKILSALERKTDGGTLQGVSSAIFLQLIQMEHRSCTIRLTERSTERRGTLFFLEGELIDARFGTRQGETAAQEIFTWKEVNLAIQNSCAGDHRRRIERGLEAILLDAMRLQDETAGTAATPPQDEMPSGNGTVQSIRRRLEAVLGTRHGRPKVRTDGAASGLLAAIGELGMALSLGRFHVAHFVRDQGLAALLVAGEPPVTVQLGHKAPRDRVLDVLRED